MGYNGSNRRGAPRSMWKTSSNRAGNSMLFGKRGIVTGLFDVGSCIVKDTINTTPRNNKDSSNNIISNKITPEELIEIQKLARPKKFLFPKKEVATLTSLSLLSFLIAIITG